MVGADRSEGLRQGYGIYTYKDGTVYRGEWARNVKCGGGVLQRSDGHIYLGYGGAAPL